MERGLKAKPWVKTSLAPGSKVVTDYLQRGGLMPYLEQLGFHLVGYGCTTCIGNSGPLPEAMSPRRSTKENLVVAAVLSGNRNFEGRINPLVSANYLASPPLVVAYALAGTDGYRPDNEPLGAGSRRQAGLSEGHLADQRGSRGHACASSVHSEMFEQRVRATSSTATQQLEAPCRCPTGEIYAVGRRLDLHQAAAVLRRTWWIRRRRCRTCTALRVLALLGDSRHHRPHLAGRLDRQGQPGRAST